MRTSLSKIVCAILSITILSCTKTDNQKFQPAMQNAPGVIPACGVIDLVPSNNIYNFTNVTFTGYLPAEANLSTISWKISKDNTEIYTSSQQTFTRIFNGPNEGSGLYTANLTFDKGDGNTCSLKKSFRVLHDDICVPPSGISGQLVGFIGEETSPFSVNFENCFIGRVVWDMDNNGSIEYEGDATESFAHTYTQAGTYSVVARVYDQENDNIFFLYHNIEIKGKSCINPFTNEVVSHGEGVEFAKPNPACGQSCLTATRTCNNGTFDGDITFIENPLTCETSEECPPKPCDNGAINSPECNECPTGELLINGTCQKPTYKWKVGEWSECTAVACGTSGTQTRTVQCVRHDNTVVDDSFCKMRKPQDEKRCSAPACLSCNLPWGGTISHNQEVTAYKTPTAPYGHTCHSQTRKCINGNLTGTFTNQNCSVLPPQNCQAPWGETIAHGQTVTAYKASAVACGQTCQSQARTCHNGSLSGSFSKKTCSVAACPVNGVCGSSDGKTFLNPPTSNLCSKGAASTVTTTNSNYNWTCSGQNGGTNASCSAHRQHFSTASCGFGLKSSAWSTTPGQPTSSYGSCEWAGQLYLKSSNQVNATFFFGDFYDTSGPYGIFRLRNPSHWTITATGCQIGTIRDPQNPRKIMPNYCQVTGYRHYYGIPMIWNATITAKNNVTGETKVMPIKATFKPQLVSSPGLIKP